MAGFSEKGALFDGRDVGTIVPSQKSRLQDFLLTAQAYKSVLRSDLKQLQEKESDSHPSLEQLMSDIESRDRQDSNRGSAPLLQAEDAIFFDTSDLDLTQSVDKMVSIIKDATK